jgi:hypothetical protein
LLQFIISKVKKRGKAQLISGRAGPSKLIGQSR